jgi:hypothetical protein
MKEQLRRVTLGIFGAALIGTAGLASADPMESVTGLDVHNPPAFLAALERYNQTDAAQRGNVTIWAVEFSGASEISHLAIGNFDGYADYERTTTERNRTPEWQAFVGSLQSLLDVESRLMAIERFRDGSGWEGHGAMAAFVMTVSDPATYAAAFAELTGSMDNPGSVRLMELRFGGQGATHAALISAANVTELNEYLDELLSSNAYREFAGKVSGIRTINNVEMLRRVVSYGD